MFQYNLVQHPSFSLDNKIIDSIFLSCSNIVSKNQEGCLNIVFVDEDSIQKLNKDFRNKDVSTDVLSFHYHEDFSSLQATDIAGEIVLSESHILKQGAEYGLGEEKETYKLIIHSLLHILGYDHEDNVDYKIMQGLEDTIWEELFEK